MIFHFSLSFLLCFLFGLLLLGNRFWKQDSKSFILSAEAIILPPALNLNDALNGELLSLQVIHRHGDRTPVYLLPSDPYVNYSFPEGLGGLINEGKQRLFRYGQALRRRYSNYVGMLIT